MSDIPAQAVQRAKSGDTVAWGAIAQAFGGAIVKEASYWSSRGGGQIADLEQEGQLGLRRAIETYDPRRGSFVQHAWAWVRKFVQAAAVREMRHGKVEIIGEDVVEAAEAAAVVQTHQPSLVDTLARRQLGQTASREVRAAAVTAQERAVVDQRLLTNSPKPLRQVGKSLGLSASRVLTIERRVMSRACIEVKKQRE